MKKYIIAIDGPAGSGKSTISRIVANKLNFVYVKTGEMYRAITYKLLKENIDYKKDLEGVINVLNNLDLKIKYTVERQYSILDGVDITDRLSDKDITDNVSQVSAIKEVRDKVLEYEQSASDDCNIIMEGRDIGTVVFPNADVKIYLDSTVEERAKRRYKQNLEKGIDIPFDEIVKNIEFRDNIDKNKAFGALKVADDAIVVENNGKMLSEVVNEIVELIKSKIGDNL